MQAPVKFITHLLNQLSLKIDGVKETSHWRAPILTGTTTAFSFKLFSWDVFRDCIEEQTIVKLDKVVHYRNGKVITEENITKLGDKSAEDILNDIDSTISYATPRAQVLESEITVNEGVGRRTREIELIWFTNLFSQEVHTGKLMLRFFVSKANI